MYCCQCAKAFRLALLKYIHIYCIALFHSVELNRTSMRWISFHIKYVLVKWNLKFFNEMKQTEKLSSVEKKIDSFFFCPFCSYLSRIYAPPTQTYIYIYLTHCALCSLRIHLMKLTLKKINNNKTTIQKLHYKLLKSETQQRRKQIILITL